MKEILIYSTLFSQSLYFIVYYCANIYENDTIPLIWNIQITISIIDLQKGQINQLKMYISHLLSPKKPSKGELLTSIIAPDPSLYTNLHQFQTKKIALADKILITEYQRRIQRKINNTPQIYLTKDSDFYITVHIEKIQKFNRMDFLMLPYNQRAKILLDILEAVIGLIQIYGFFYFNEGMVGYKSDGSLKVWINEDYFKNKPQFPLNHGRLNEEIFITDFKECFCGNFREMKEFKKARNIGSLRILLGKGNGIYSSSLLSEPVCKESFISRDQNLKFSYFIAPNGEKQNQQFIKHSLKGLKHSESMNIFVKECNNEVPMDNNQNNDKKLIRTLSSPGSIRTSNPIFSNLSQDKIAFGRGSTTNIPRINFTYSSGNEAWRRKIMNQHAHSQSLYKSLKLKKNQLTPQNSKQLLKVSFPHTTTHSFSPIASNGSINITTLKEIVQQQTPYNQERNSQNMILREIKSQVIDEIQNEFDNLFQSNIEQQRQCENLEIIMQEFENILQA